GRLRRLAGRSRKTTGEAFRLPPLPELPCRHSQLSWGNIKRRTRELSETRSLRLKSLRRSLLRQAAIRGSLNRAFPTNFVRFDGERRRDAIGADGGGGGGDPRADADGRRVRKEDALGKARPRGYPRAGSSHPGHVADRGPAHAGGVSLAQAR